ncbi:MAG: mechanosensitive ion channel protein MscS [Verrucomicrobia bacterium]|nr:MAG: mechanosensitive ion channel protein MscS [Verrucomicrobiota bacterium]
MAFRKVFSLGFSLTAISATAAEQAAVAEKARQTTPIQDKIISYVIDHSGKLIGAAVVVVAGIIVSRFIADFARRWLEKKPLEPPVRLLMTRVARVAVLAVAFLIALGTAGADVTALVAGLSVAGVGVGLAMQGVLSNLFAGLTIIFTKPFRVGEYIQLLGVEGQVDMIELLSTSLRHGDLSRVVIPNRKIVGEILHNYGTIRQLDLTVGVAYQSDLVETLAIIHDILSRNSRVMKDPAPGVGVATLADSAINIAIKPWTSVADSGPAKAELYQAIVERFRERNISIPFPQREVRMLNNNASS